MPISTPTAAEILAEIKADLRLELGKDPLRRSPEYALGRALLAQSRGQYRFLRRVHRQGFPDTADEDTFWRWFAIYGLSRLAATPWQGVVRFTGVDTTVIPAGSTVVRSDGVTYETDAPGTIGSTTSGLVDIAVTAASGYEGAAGNNDNGDPLEVAPSITDVDPECTVQSTTLSGGDQETAEEGLSRLLARLRTPPSGGGPGDYVAWAREVSGVTRAWEFPGLYGPNTVGVAFVRDNDGSGSAIIPDAGERTTVQTYLDGVAPITVAVTVIPIAAQTVNVQIDDLDPPTAAVKAAIQTSLEDFFLKEGEPGGTMTYSQISGAITNAYGERSHVLTTPADSVVSTVLQMPILGTITYG